MDRGDGSAARGWVCGSARGRPSEGVKRHFSHLLRFSTSPPYLHFLQAMCLLCPPPLLPPPPSPLPPSPPGEWPYAIAVAACLSGDAASHAAYSAAIRTAAAGPPESAALAARAAAQLRASGGVFSGSGGGWAGGSALDLGAQRGPLPATALRLVDAAGVVLQQASEWVVAEPGTPLLSEVVRGWGGGEGRGGLCSFEHSHTPDE